MSHKVIQNQVASANYRNDMDTHCENKYQSNSLKHWYIYIFVLLLNPNHLQSMTKKEVYRNRYTLKSSICKSTHRQKLWAPGEISPSYKALICVRCND